MRLRLTIHCGLILILALGAASVAGCDKGKKKDKKFYDNPGYEMPETRKTDRVYHESENQCNLNRPVENPKKGSAEAAIQGLLIAARDAAKAKSPEGKSQAFAVFYGQFEGVQKSIVSSSGYWGAAIKHHGRYLDKAGKGAFAFRICEDDEQEKSRKIVILSYDNKKSNPPIKLAKDSNGVWKVKSLSPL